MNNKLSWEEIKQQYDREWIELVDYEWVDADPYPHSGVVRVHAKTRAEFHDVVAKLPPADSAILYVGNNEATDDTIFRLWPREEKERC